MNPAAVFSSKQSNLTSTLIRSYPPFRDALPGLWLDSPHQVETGASVGLSLRLLDQILTGIDLAPVVPTSLAEAVRKRKLTFIGGRLCAERVADHLGYPGITVGRGAGGPPVWPAGLCGSITHVDSFAYSSAVHSSFCNGLGIDSEWVGGPETVDTILRICLTGHEKKMLIDGEDDPLIATLIFSAKEAAYKAIYGIVERFVDFTEFEVTDLQRHIGRLVLTPVADSDLRGVIQPLNIDFNIQMEEQMLIHTWCIYPQRASLWD